MIGAVIYYGKNTLVAELPMGTMDLQMKLSSIGVGEPADRIPLKDDEDDLAETWIDSHPYLNLSAELEEYFDFSAYGGDLLDEYNGRFVSNGFVYMEGSIRLEDILDEAQDMDLE